PPRPAPLGPARAPGAAPLPPPPSPDRLHEPFRLPDAPVLAELQDRPVEGQAGVTLSGSGPSVVVWLKQTCPVPGVVTELQERFPDARVLPLKIAAKGAH